MPDQEYNRGITWFNALDEGSKGDLGDAFVLGTFDWRDWGFEEKPSGKFLRGADYARMLWESIAS